jgi:hypothetical protein
MFQIIWQTHSVIINAPERIEVPKKTTQALYVVNRGRVATTKRDNAPNNRPRKKKTRPLQKIVNVSQPVVETPCGYSII